MTAPQLHLELHMLNAFIEDCLVYDETAEVFQNHVYLAYYGYCLNYKKENQLSTSAMKRIRFAKKLMQVASTKWDKTLKKYTSADGNIFQHFRLNIQGAQYVEIGQKAKALAQKPNKEIRMTNQQWNSYTMMLLMMCFYILSQSFIQHLQKYGPYSAQKSPRVEGLVQA